MVRNVVGELFPMSLCSGHQVSNLKIDRGRDTAQKPVRVLWTQVMADFVPHTVRIQMPISRADRKTDQDGPRILLIVRWILVFNDESRRRLSVQAPKTSLKLAFQFCVHGDAPEINKMYLMIQDLCVHGLFSLGATQESRWLGVDHAVS